MIATAALVALVARVGGSKEMDARPPKGLNALRVVKANESPKTALELRRLDCQLATCDAAAVADFARPSPRADP